MTTAGRDGLIEVMGHRRAARSREGRPRISRAASQFLVSALAVVLFAATLLAGSRYFHCSMDGETRLSSCCPEHQSETPIGGAELRSTSCCEPRLIDGLPTAQVMRCPAIGAAPLVAVLPPFHVIAPASVQLERILTARSGSDPPTASQARAQLMVFLI